MNKAGQFEVARKTIYWMIAGVVITMVMIAFAMIIVDYKNKLTEVPPQLKADLLSLRFTHNPECFAYDDGKKTYPNIIDFARFNNETLSSCYHTETEKGYEDYNFGLVLKNKNVSLSTNNYFHKDDFTITKTILLYDQGEFIKDELIIYVQVEI